MRGYCYIIMEEINDQMEKYMNKFLVLLFCILMFTDVVYAEQFRTWQGYVINKQMVTHVVPSRDKDIEVYYPAGTSCPMASETTLKYSNKTQRDQKLKEMIKWLNSKD